MGEETSGSRIVVKMPGIDARRVELITGDQNFYPNDNEVYSYECNWSSLMGIADAIRDGRDGCQPMFNFISKEGTFRLTKDNFNVDKDHNGQVFSKVESQVLKTYKFYGFVNPSPGTIFRHAKTFGPRGIHHASIRVYFIKPYLWPNCSQNELDDFNVYMSLIEGACSETRFKLEKELVTWDELPNDKFLYFSSSGWKLHEKHLLGCGLELNVNVATALSNTVVNFSDCNAYYDINYMKNGKICNFKYYKIPAVARIHGADFCSSFSTNLEMSLFNVLTTKEFATHNNFKISDIRMAHCANRLVVSQIVNTKEVFINGNKYVFGLNAVNQEVCLLYPACELSTRRNIFRQLGYAEVPYITGPFSVCSSITSKYINFSVDNVPTDVANYDPVICMFPSKWMYDGNRWYLRAYPEAFKMVPTTNSSVKIDGNGYRLAMISEYSDENAIWCQYDKDTSEIARILLDGLVDKTTLECEHHNGIFFSKWRCYCCICSYC